jgi:hypothetical protein
MRRIRRVCSTLLGCYLNHLVLYLMPVLLEEVVRE